MAQLRVVILWHQHQPFYKDLVTGRYRLPWTRLHALKDYYGMVKLLDEFPQVHQTFNLVPSLITQIQDYVSGDAQDPFLQVASKPARELTEQERRFALQYLFQAHPVNVIGRYPRYRELWEKFRNAGDSPERADRYFQTQDFTDLQVLSLPYASTVQQLQEAATLVRTVGDIRQVFTNIEWRALVVRGTPDQVTLAAWLVGQLGQPVSADLTASPTYPYPDVDHHETMIRVFWVKDAPTIAAFQQIVTRVRTATKIRRVFTYNASMAMAVRGTEAQLLTAAQMLQDQQVASK